MNILQMGQGSHILAFTDSSSALSWMHKASFDPVKTEYHNAVSRWLGWTLVINETSISSQHIKVTENIITDYLSQDFHRSNQTLTKLFNRIVPPQTAASFHIKQLLRIASGSLDASNGISKVTAIKQSGNLYMWCKFLKHSVIADEFMGGIPQEQRKILVPSFAASVQHHQFGTTRK